MKQGVKIYKWSSDKFDVDSLKFPANPELVAGGGRFKSMFELVQADMRKQNQLGWYVHQVIKGDWTDDDKDVEAGLQGNNRWMVIYRRDEEM